MTRPALPIPLSLEERLLLEDMLRSRKTPERLRLRCQIILMGADGLANSLIATRLKLTRSTVLEWRRRFEVGRIQALTDEGGEGASTDSKSDRTNHLRGLLDIPPPDGSAVWTVRALAKAANCSPATIQRALEASNMRVNPRRPAFPVNPAWVGKIVDVAGLYLHSPYHTVAFEVDLGKDPVPSSRLLPTPKPGEPAWLLYLHLRSLEGLRQMEGRSTHYSSSFWRFLSGLQPKTPGNLVWCLTDTPMHPEHLKQLEFEKPHLRITGLEPGLAWLETMKTIVLPALQNHVGQGSCPSIEDSVQALESFIRNGCQDPLEWRASA